jgi:CubicO group peptidase (beta-lactamase class C family)
MTVAMHTRIGSVTKTFTGTVVMRLSQDHKLSLDDPIEKYVSGVPNGNSITLRQLANMTSGVATACFNRRSIAVANDLSSSTICTRPGTVTLPIKRGVYDHIRPLQPEHAKYRHG